LKQEGEETGDPETSYTKLIAVHAGVESKSVDNQMQMLQNKDAQRPRIEPLAGRKNVWNTPPVRSPSHSLVSSPNHNSLSRSVILELFLHQSSLLLPSNVATFQARNVDRLQLLYLC
jgi:hypothetical protein